MKLKVNINGMKRTVEREAYVKAKIKQLQEFGYTNLTADEVNEQIDAVLTGKKFGAGLTVIGGFIGDEIDEETK